MRHGLIFFCLHPDRLPSTRCLRSILHRRKRTLDPRHQNPVWLADRASIISPADEVMLIKIMRGYAGRATS
jgi:hypothetical protein